MATFTDFTLTTSIDGNILSTLSPYGLAYYKGFIYTSIIIDNIPYIYKIKFTDGSAPVTQNTNGGTNYYQIDSFNEGDEIRQMRVYNQYLYFLYNSGEPNSGKLYRINLELFINVGDEYQLQVDRQLIIDNLNDPRGFVKFEVDTYITCADKIIRWTSSEITNLLLSTDTDSNGDIMLNSPYGIDTDGNKLYFCNYGTTNKKIYRFNINDPSTNEIIAITTNGKNDGLCLYGKYLYVCANDDLDKKIFRFNIKEDILPITIGTGNVFDTLDSRPNQIIFVNNKIFYTSYSSNKIQTRLFNTDFENGTAFSMSLALPSEYEYFDNSQYQEGLNTGLDYKTITYTLNNNLTIDNSITWEEVGFTSSKIIIDGNQKTITIDAETNIGTNTLFFGGGRRFNVNDKWNNTILEIKNLTIISNQNIICGLLRAYGFVKITNCKLELTGNFYDNAGGLVYNNYGQEDYDYSKATISMSNSAVIVKGKIGENSGALCGFFSYGCSATINNCYSIVLDNNTGELDDKTLQSSSGAFVGSGIGANSEVSVTISNSFCIFSGSMGHGSGIIGGKFLGANSSVNISKFYAITNIPNYTLGDGSVSQQPYILSCYVGGTIGTLELEDINILHLGTHGPDFNIYDNTDVVPNLNIHTNFNSFKPLANGSAAVGEYIYYLNYKPKPVSGPSGYLCYSPILMPKSVLIGTNNTLLNVRTLTFNTIPTKTYGDSSFSLSDYVSVEPNATINYVNNDDIPISISDGVVSITAGGDASITAYVDYDESSGYSYSEETMEFSVNKVDSSLSSFTIAEQIIGNTPFTPSLPTILVGNGTISYTSSDSSVATINSVTGLITILNIGLSVITATLSGTNQYNSTTKTSNILVLDNEVVLQSAIKLKQIGLIDSVILNIRGFSIENEAYYGGLLINFNWLDTDNKKKIARHEMLNIIFNLNPIITFGASKEFLGLENGLDTIKIYKTGITLNVTGNENSYYVNLTENGTNFILQYDDYSKIIRKIANHYVVDDNNYSDGDSVNLFNDNITLHFGGAHIIHNLIPCLTEDTTVLTPRGYINVEQLSDGDLVITHDNREVEIVKIFKTIVRGCNKTYPCIIPKNSICPNYPSQDFKISSSHLIKLNDFWINPKSYFQVDKSKNYIKYYHIKLNNYITDHLVINNGVIVESLGNHPSEKLNISYLIEYKKRLQSIPKYRSTMIRK